MDFFNKKKVATLENEIKQLKETIKIQSENLDNCLDKNKTLKEEYTSQANKYKPIIDIEQEVSKAQYELTEKKKECFHLKRSYEENKAIYDDLKKEITQFRDIKEMAEYGLYEPIFNYEDSETFKKAILLNKEKQKLLISQGLAAKCYTDWVVSNSKKKGEVMTKRQIKLMLRAFNGECNSFISKVKWNNLLTIDNRILSSFNAINNQGKSNDIMLQMDYLELKREELRLTHEYHLKKQQEKEERREINARIREEEKAQRDFEKAQREAEKEEKRYQKALEEAQKALGLVSGEELNKLNSEISKLKEQLELTQEYKERALSMAQQTRCGYVYIISNIGSFGEDMFKIGLTRRLEPLDRVRELGDASVPFKFDVHAMLYSEDAPALEKELHNKFRDRSVNLVNFRKEFFNVSLEEIKQAVHELKGDEIDFIEIPEAQEYRETKNILKIKSEQNEMKKQEEDNKYPDKLSFNI